MKRPVRGSRQHRPLIKNLLFFRTYGNRTCSNMEELA